MRHRSIISTTSVALLMTTAGIASADPLLRVQVTQRGDFVLIGNTLGHDCAAGVPAPVVGTVGMCGSNTNDTSPDVFWQSDTPMAGQASANNTITAANARSTAVLNVPAGATVTHAYLYWSARSTGAAGDMAVTLDGPGGFNGMVTAADSITTGFGGTYYQSAADITSIVQMRGNGAYRVSGVDSAALTNLNDAQISAGWWMVVLYELPGDKLRTIAVRDGLDQVVDQSPVMAT
ncbi:MAG TPA: hypothetical protein PKA58_25915, partial [Polyangium sp.]|nr:hypothetical protein [Polyangium sp.]